MTQTSQNGIGAATGPDLATCAPLVHGGAIWFVNSTTGSDTANDGLDRTLPFATLQKAVTESSDGDIIVMLATHAETISTVITVSKCLDIIGESTSSSTPSVVLTLGGTTSNMFTVDSVRASLRGVRFATPAATTTGSYVSLASLTNYSLFSMSGCYMPMNGYNTGYGLKVSVEPALVDISDCTFISTATSVSAKPRPAVCGGVSSGHKLTIKDCTFDGGTVGFATSGIAAAHMGSWALYSDASSAVWRITGTDFLNGADVGIYSQVAGYISQTAASSSARIVELFPS